jgi:mono/diheme cytochrome c family protein
MKTIIAVFLLSSFAAVAQDAVKGKATFLRIGCYECHGTVGQGGTGPRLAPRPLPAAGLIAFVRNPTRMPPYTAKVVSDADLTDIRAYLATIPAPPPVKDIALLNP